MTKTNCFRTFTALATMAAAILLASLLLITARPAHAATFSVTNINDSGPGSLRQAITDANAATGDDTINISATGTINLKSALPQLFTNMEIKGPGADKLTVRRDTSDPYLIFKIFDSNVTISGLTVTNGNGFGDAGGIGNIDNTGGHSVTLEDVTVSNNTATASASSGSSGGGISNFGTLTLIDSTVSGNSAAGGGGGGVGGGIFNYPGKTLTLINSTVSGNSVPAVPAGRGGGIMNDGTVTLTNTTLSDNSAPAGTLTGSNLTTDSPGTVTLKNTIVANPKGGGANCAGSITSQGNNLFSDGSCVPTGTGDIQNQDPKLGALDFYGGPTKTHAILAESPAIDAGTNTGCPATDQRGTSRPQDGDENGTPVCDIGAFEQDDVVQPTVNSVTPLEDKKRVRRGVNIKATFSEKMERTTLTKDTVKLVNTKTGAKVEDVSVSCDAECMTVTLNPAAPLAKKTKYEVTITTDTKDRAGNALDQDTTTAVDEPKVWYFTTGKRR